MKMRKFLLMLRYLSIMGLVANLFCFAFYTAMTYLGTLPDISAPYTDTPDPYLEFYAKYRYQYSVFILLLVCLFFLVLYNKTKSKTKDLLTICFAIIIVSLYILIISKYFFDGNRMEKILKGIIFLTPICIAFSHGLVKYIATKQSYKIISSL